jgi:hypothetical protein
MTGEGSRPHVSEKQQLYCGMLRDVLPWLRNVQTWGWWSRLRDRSAWWDSELVHNLPVTLLERDFTDHDLWFLNVQARGYCQGCSPRLSPNYDSNVTAIRRLFAIVPADLRGRLKWSGP